MWDEKFEALMQEALAILGEGGLTHAEWKGRINEQASDPQGVWIATDVLVASGKVFAERHLYYPARRLFRKDDDTLKEALEEAAELAEMLAEGELEHLRNQVTLMYGVVKAAERWHDAPSFSIPDDCPHLELNEVCNCRYLAYEKPLEDAVNEYRRVK